MLDEHGVQVGAQQVQLPEHSPALWTGLFDTRRYVLLHQGNLLLEGQTRPATAAELLEHLGVFLGTDVLGAGIMGVLTQSVQRRTLLVRLGRRRCAGRRLCPRALGDRSTRRGPTGLAGAQSGGAPGHGGHRPAG